MKNFEKVLNSLRATQNVSIFITGSNANLLSGELATLLAGRYVTFKIMPFTFAECLQIQNITNPTDSDLMNYLKFGGMPQRFYLSTESEIKTFLSDLYDSIVLKDIISRYKVKNVELLDKIISYLASTNSEIDFIATKDGQREYYQVAYILHDENTIKREFGVYQKVKDNFPKFVISADHFDFSQDGIIHKNVIQWLLEG